MATTATGERKMLIGSMVHAADFERVLRVRSRAQSAHFAMHHLGERPERAMAPSGSSAFLESKTAPQLKLSTGNAPGLAWAVDECDAPVDFEAVAGSVEKIWLGTVIPKRHARRSVTRSLIKRQVRAVVARRALALDAGFWIVRLRAPFDASLFRSAAPEALRCMARDELLRLIDGVSRCGAPC